MTPLSWRGEDVIQVGQVLDKYELLERVGQGGMAVVYRGIDRTLKRTVAIKILHKHLSDYQEARDRFEREAQAVAKLRHENILEIFDYSAAEAAEAAGSSYIVTEFIDGQTLKQFITERPIGYPEVGAMVILQVCRALAHAHGAGILHRDIKPENIMIRSDGVVKLMDFGISHMVDLERLTVTGQLLGSPAYMAPEHVEGRPLDFRTDVFAVGIVLYQLAVGKLPFEGKNPHEVLKRIAECKFIDPRQANPRIGNRLGRIILRAMAAAPDGRYPAIGEMVMAIEGYLEESGLPADKVAGELARYFKAPPSYELALKERLVDHLTKRGQKLLDSEKGAALDVFDRVLTIDKNNAKVIAILDGINRRRRVRSLAIAVACASVLAVGAWGLHKALEPPPAEPPPPLDVKIVNHNGPHTHVEQEDPPPVAIVDDAAPPTILDASVAATVDAHAPDDAPAVITKTPKTPLHISVFPALDSFVQIGNGVAIPVPSSGAVDVEVELPVVVHARNEYSVEDQRTINVGDANQVSFQLTMRPATVVPRCASDVPVRIDGKPAQLNQSNTIIFPPNGMFRKKNVVVEFVGETIDARTIEVTAGKSTEVKCGQQP
jgi:serine/threonine-protein kinase